MRPTEKTVALVQNRSSVLRMDFVTHGIGPSSNAVDNAFVRRDIGEVEFGSVDPGVQRMCVAIAEARDHGPTVELHDLVERRRPRCGFVTDRHDSIVFDSERRWRSPI